MIDPAVPATPARAKGDVAHAMAKAGLGSIPLVGDAAAELFTLVVSPPLEKRRDEWMKQMGEAIDQLRKEFEGLGKQIEDLQDNSAFMDTALQASQIALRNSTRPLGARFLAFVTDRG